jgi:hypothetical protein
MPHELGTNEALLVILDAGRNVARGFSSCQEM